MSEQKNFIEYEDELYTSICDLEGVKCALSANDCYIGTDAQYGLWRIVDRTTDRLKAIQKGMEQPELKPEGATG